MSEMGTDQVNTGGGGSGNVFTRQLGPMPLWGWMAVGLALVLLYVYWKKDQASQSTSGTSSDTSGGSGTTDSSLIPQFVNQVYTQTSPPSPGPQGPAGPQGATGTTGAQGATGGTTTATTTPPAKSSSPAPVTQAKEYPAPTGLKVDALSGTSVRLSWNYITSVTPKPTSYTVAIYNTAGKLISQTTVDAPDTAGGTATATVSGLPSKQKLQYHVWANGGKVAPPHAAVTALD